MGLWWGCDGVVMVLIRVVGGCYGVAGGAMGLLGVDRGCWVLLGVLGVARDC